LEAEEAERAERWRLKAEKRATRKAKGPYWTPERRAEASARAKAQIAAARMGDPSATSERTA
jgi:hypothetical protein